MMRFELGLEEPDPGRALRSALTIAGAYIAGGMIPLAPYMLVGNSHTALLASIGFTLTALFVFGYVKGRYTRMPPLPSAVRTTVIGSLAAAAAFGIASLVSEK
jgi:VIT1/CCC1 family predicted Fe2+/Mn2+ transporter